jgi:hypothetical protein
MLDQVSIYWKIPPSPQGVNISECDLGEKYGKGKRKRRKMHDKKEEKGKKKEKREGKRENKK